MCRQIDMFMARYRLITIKKKQKKKQLFTAMEVLMDNISGCFMQFLNCQLDNVNAGGFFFFAMPTFCF